VTQRFQLGGGVSFTDQRFANTTNTNSVSEYTLFDAMAAYRLTDEVTLRVNATNLTNAEYYGRIYQGHAVPGTGRTVLMTTSFKF
jgi:catecholate siderophore receptor